MVQGGGDAEPRDGFGHVSCGRAGGSTCSASAGPLLARRVFALDRAAWTGGLGIDGHFRSLSRSQRRSQRRGEESWGPKSGNRVHCATDGAGDGDRAIREGFVGDDGLRDENWERPRAWVLCCQRVGIEYEMDSIEASGERMWNRSDDHVRWWRVGGFCVGVMVGVCEAEESYGGCEDREEVCICVVLQLTLEVGSSVSGR